jgi:hypothetical protein
LCAGNASAMYTEVFPYYDSVAAYGNVTTNWYPPIGAQIELYYAYVTLNSYDANGAPLLYYVTLYDGDQVIDTSPVRTAYSNYAVDSFPGVPRFTVYSNSSITLVLTNLNNTYVYAGSNSVASDALFVLYYESTIPPENAPATPAPTPPPAPQDLANCGPCALYEEGCWDMSLATNVTALLRMPVLSDNCTFGFYADAEGVDPPPINVSACIIVPSALNITNRSVPATSNAFADCVSHNGTVVNLVSASAAPVCTLAHTNFTQSNISRVDQPLIILQPASMTAFTVRAACREVVVPGETSPTQWSTVLPVAYLRSANVATVASHPSATLALVSSTTRPFSLVNLTDVTNIQYNPVLAPDRESSVCNRALVWVDDVFVACINNQTNTAYFLTLNLTLEQPVTTVVMSVPLQSALNSLVRVISINSTAHRVLVVSGVVVSAFDLDSSTKRVVLAINISDSSGAVGMRDADFITTDYIAVTSGRTPTAISILGVDMPNDAAVWALRITDDVTEFELDALRAGPDGTLWAVLRIVRGQCVTVVQVPQEADTVALFTGMACFQYGPQYLSAINSTSDAWTFSGGLATAVGVGIFNLTTGEAVLIASLVGSASSFVRLTPFPGLFIGNQTGSVAVARLVPLAALQNNSLSKLPPAQATAAGDYIYRTPRLVPFSYQVAGSDLVDATVFVVRSVATIVGDEFQCSATLSYVGYYADANVVVVPPNEFTKFPVMLVLVDGTLYVHNVAAWSGGCEIVPDATLSYELFDQSTYYSVDLVYLPGSNLLAVYQAPKIIFLKVEVNPSLVTPTITVLTEIDGPRRTMPISLEIQSPWNCYYSDVLTGSGQFLAINFCNDTLAIIDTMQWTGINVVTGVSPNAVIASARTTATGTKLMVAAGNGETGIVKVYNLQLQESAQSGNKLLPANGGLSGRRFVNFYFDTFATGPTGSTKMVVALRDAADQARFTTTVIDASPWYDDSNRALQVVSTVSIRGSSLCTYYYDYYYYYGYTECYVSLPLRLATTSDGFVAIFDGRQYSSDNQTVHRLYFDDSLIVSTYIPQPDDFTTPSVALGTVGVGTTIAGSFIALQGALNPIGAVRFVDPLTSQAVAPPSWMSFYFEAQSISFDRPPQSLTGVATPMQLAPASCSEINPGLCFTMFSQVTVVTSLKLRTDISLVQITTPAAVLSVTLAVLVKSSATAAIAPQFGHWMSVAVSPTTTYTSPATISMLGSVDAINRQLASLKYCNATAEVAKDGGSSVSVLLDASDSLNTPAQQLLTLANFRFDPSPTVTGTLEDVTVRLGDARSFSLNTTVFGDDNLPSLVFLVTSNVTWVSYTPQTGFISIQPPRVKNMTAAVTVQAYDGCSTSPPLSFNIFATETPPYVTNTSLDCAASVHLGEQAVIYMPADVFADDGLLQYSVAPLVNGSVLPAWIQVSAQGSTIVVTGVSRALSDIRTVSFALVGSDGVYDARYNCSITFTDSPPALSANATTSLNVSLTGATSYQFNVGANIVDEDNSLTFDLIADPLTPPWVTIIPPSTVSLSPVVDAAKQKRVFIPGTGSSEVEQYWASYPIRVTASPSNGVGLATNFTFMLGVIGTYPSVAASRNISLTPTLPLGAGFSQTLEGLFTDETFALSSTSLPPWMSLSSADRRLSGIPLPEPNLTDYEPGFPTYSQTYDVQVAATGGSGGIALTTVVPMAVQVVGVYPIPTVVSQNTVWDLGRSDAFDVSRIFTKVAGTTMTYSAVQASTGNELPTWAFFDSVSGLLSVTPQLHSTAASVVNQPTYRYTYSFTFTAIAKALVARQTVDFVVSHNGPDITKSSLAARTLQLGSVGDLSFVGIFVLQPGQPYQYSFSNPVPPFVLLNGGDSNVAWQVPFSATPGVVSTSVVVTDGYLAASVSWNFTVPAYQPVTSATAFVDATWTVGDKTSAAVVPPGTFANPAGYNLRYGLTDPDNGDGVLPEWIRIDPDGTIAGNPDDSLLAKWEFDKTVTFNLSAYLVGAPGDASVPKQRVASTEFKVELSMPYEARLSKVMEIIGIVVSTVGSLAAVVVYYSTIRNIIAGKKLYKGRRMWHPDTNSVPLGGGEADIDEVIAVRKVEEGLKAKILQKLSYFLWIDNTADRLVNNGYLPTWMQLNMETRELVALPQYVRGDANEYLIRVFGPHQRLLEEFTVVAPGEGDTEMAASTGLAALPMPLSVQEQVASPSAMSEPNADSASQDAPLLTVKD